MTHPYLAIGFSGTEIHADFFDWKKLSSVDIERGLAGSKQHETQI